MRAADGHRVLAVVAGSAVNQDGASNGLTAPNGPSQQRVIRAGAGQRGAAARPGGRGGGARDGDALGDPIEAQALMATYGQGRAAGRPLWLGSVKSNIGHAQAAAGVAGVIKMVLALRHGMLPPTLHVDEPSPHVDWSAGAVRLLTEAVPWPRGDRPRRAGVSSFGISGTNAHVILEEAPAEPASRSRRPGGLAVPVLGPGAVAWVVSGRTAGGLAGQAGRLAEWWPPGRAWTWPMWGGRWRRPGRRSSTGRWSPAAAGRSWRRAGGGGGGRAGPGRGDRDGRRPTRAGSCSCSPVRGRSGPGWAGSWRRARRCSRRGWLSAGGAGPVRGLVAGGGCRGAAARLDRVDVVQPALWAVMVSLAAVWQAAGVVPDAVVGHSQGEIAAAYVAGVLSLEDAARVVALRSRALGVLAGRGGMVSVAEPAGRSVSGWRPGVTGVSVAAVNGPAATVVSGEPGALAELARQCAATGCGPGCCRSTTPPTRAGGADPRDVLAALAGVVAGPGAGPDGLGDDRRVAGRARAGRGYWYASLRAPVEFDRAVRALAGDGHRVFIEVSPHPVLTAAIPRRWRTAGRGGPGGGRDAAP